MIQETAHEWAVLQLRVRLRGGRHARAAARLRPGRPRGAGASRSSDGTATAIPPTRSGEAIPLAMRVVHLSHDMEAIGRIFSPDQRARGRPRSPRPHVRPGARRPVRRSTETSGSSGSRTTEPWDAVLGARAGAAPHASTARRSTTRSPSPPTSSTSSRRTWAGTAAAARSSPPMPPGCSGSPTKPSRRLRRAALVHDFGTTAVPNSIWDKPGSLTRTEFDRVELHPMLTEQMLRRSPALAALNPVACAHHEKCDGSGYHKRVRAGPGDLGRVPAGRDGDLRRDDHRASGPSRVLAR